MEIMRETIDTLTEANRLRRLAFDLFAARNWTVCLGAAKCWQDAEKARQEAEKHGPRSSWSTRLELARTARDGYRGAIAWQQSAEASGKQIPPTKSPPWPELDPVPTQWPEGSAGD